MTLETETQRQTRATPVGPAPDLAGGALYFNRELSWLDFNDRVLQIAEDPTKPLLERVKFAAIYEANLDEFFMIRVAGLHDQVEAGADPRGPDRMPPAKALAAVRERVSAQRSRLAACFERELRPALAEHGIRIVSAAAAGGERADLERRFREQVFPVLTPLVVGRGRPFPYISNLSLSLAVLLRDPERGDEVTARVKVPKEVLPRFLPIGEEGAFVPLEDAIAANLDRLFPGMEIVEHACFKVTRDADYDVSDEADDLLQAVEAELKRRRFGEVVRLEVEAGMAPRLRDQLVDALGVDAIQLYEVDGLLDLSDAAELHDLPGFGELRDSPWTPLTQPALKGGGRGGEVDVMAAMRRGDVLVHHPYDSFATSVERFVEQAVADPDVLAIKQTVYRTSADSPLVPALIDAAERGKQAVCMVELKARFDERQNIAWAKRLEEAGVHVVYGIPRLKTHVKCILVVRREGDGVRHYVHVGTGNYHPTTATVYSDLGLLTTDPEIGADVAEMFNYLTGYARPSGYRKVLVAPFSLQQGILEEIQRTIVSHSTQRPARILMKMNALLDAPLIQALYEASRAGVRVQLNVRGICALRPGVTGASENIEVTSIVGRFLEHSRVYAFEREGEQRVYFGSPDLMPRNLYNRVELLVPVEGEAARAEILDVLERSFADNVNSWQLGEDGSWVRRSPGDGERRDLHRELMEVHAERAATAVKSGGER